MTAAHGPDGDPADPDSNAFRLRQHRELFRMVPAGYTPPPPAAVVALQDRIAAATAALTDALQHCDRIRVAAPEDVTYETLQQSGFRRADGWRRKYTLRDARRHAEYAAARLREAWDILEPPITPGPR